MIRLRFNYTVIIHQAHSGYYHIKRVIVKKTLDTLENTMKRLFIEVGYIRHNWVNIV